MRPGQAQGLGASVSPPGPTPGLLLKRTHPREPEARAFSSFKSGGVKTELHGRGHRLGKAEMTTETG